MAGADQPKIDEDEVISAALKPMKGDLDAILQRGTLRMVIPYTPIYFSYDGDKLIGFAVEIARELEVFLRETQGTKVDVILMPLPRDRILPAVIDGNADVAVANLTVTPQRAERVAFADPIFTGISELVVTGPAAGTVSSFDDLVEVGLYLRPSSSYHTHLQELNQRREAAGRQPIPVIEADAYLEDYDLLDMVHAGTIPAIVVDSHKMALWREVFEGVVVHEDLVLNENGEIAWALRKDSTRLLEAVNSFMVRVRQGSLIGNVLLNRYLGSPGWIEDIRRGDPLREYDEAVGIIKRHAAGYEFDWKMILAQAYQESRLDQSKKSGAGAIGIMQVLPSTAADPNVAIPDIHLIGNNVEAGIKYLRFLRDRYFDKPGISRLDEILFSLAAYNAGPRNVAKARKRAARMGLDADRWFSNVEVAMARTAGREPVTYVRNIYKYFVSFSLIELKSEEFGKLAAADETARPAPSGNWLGRIIAMLVVSAGAGAALYLWRRGPGA